MVYTKEETKAGKQGGVVGRKVASLHATPRDAPLLEETWRVDVSLQPREVCRKELRGQRGLRRKN